MSTERGSMIPDWDELLNLSLRGNSDVSFSSRFFAYRNRGGSRFFRISQKIIGAINRTPSYDRFLRISWTEIVDVIAAQMSESHLVTSQWQKEDPKLQPVKLVPTEKINLKFNQQPCTVLTTQKRVAFAEASCKKSDAIILLGDDDYVSVYLARAGFTDITVLDIDEAVLKRIAKTAADEGLPIEVHLQDLSQKLPEHLKKNYSLCFMDPFYSSEGVDMFLRAAVSLASRSDDPIFFLSVHLLSLFQKGLKDINNQFVGLGVEPQDLMRSFNSYPIPKGTGKVLDMVMAIFIRDPAIRQASKSFEFFTSDVVILKRQPNLAVGFDPGPPAQAPAKASSKLKPLAAVAFCLSTIMAFWGWQQLAHGATDSKVTFKKAISWMFKK